MIKREGITWIFRDAFLQRESEKKKWEENAL